MNQTVYNLLPNMSTDELLNLNQMVVAMIKSKRKAANRATARSVGVGTIVSYDSGKFGQRVTGKVTEVKRTKVVVESKFGKFLVPASMLRVE